MKRSTWKSRDVNFTEIGVYIRCVASDETSLVLLIIVLCHICEAFRMRHILISFCWVSAVEFRFTKIYFYLPSSKKSILILLVPL